MAKSSFILKQEAKLKEFETAGEAEPAVIVKADGAPVEEAREPIIPKEDEPIIPKEEVDDAQKFDVLKGKYDTETKTLRDTAEAQARTIAMLQNQVAQGATAETDDDHDETHIPKVFEKLDVEDFEGYGEEMPELVGVVNTQVETIETLREEVADLKGDVTFAKGAAEQTVSQTFWGKVNDAVEDFKDFNGDETGNNADLKWDEYLNGVDPVSGEVRRDLAGKAIMNNNHTHLIDIVKDFKKTTGWTKPVKQAKDKLESQIIPDVTGGQTTSGKPGQITKEQYNKAAKDRQFRRMSEADFEKISEQYIQSLRETG